jgi:hypothetical protein
MTEQSDTSKAASTDEQAAQTEQAKPSDQSAAPDTKKDEQSTSDAQAEHSDQDDAQDENGGRSWYFWPMVGLVVMVAVFVVGLVGALLIAIFADADNAAAWVGMIRDLFIIILAMEGMLMGIALIVLVLQLAALVNLLQNEIQPIVDNLNETSSTVRGTAQFMNENVVEPVMKWGSLTAALGGAARELFGLRRALRNARKSGDIDGPSKE